MTTRLPDQLSTDFVGKRQRLLRLALVTSVFTLLTLGMYRFWAKSRMRRWYWSAIRPGGQPLEYVGVGSEKITGFFFAVTILALWLGLVNLVLMFASLSLFAAPLVAYGLSFLGLVPIWFFARYRSRGYILARTRWRGIRFGLAKGAWGYALRALWHWIVTLITFGALWPRMTFKLEQFRTNRTFFGHQRFDQGGTWTMLWPAFAHVFVASALSAGALTLALTHSARFAWILILLGPWALYGLVHYQVMSRVLLTQNKRLGGMTLTLGADPRVVARITGFGTIALVALLVLIVVSTSVLVAFLPETILMGQLGMQDLTVPVVALLILIAVCYFVFFLMYGTLRHVFITMPIWRHYSRGFVIHHADQLGDVRQKDRADRMDADGFAEALDLGAAV